MNEQLYNQFVDQYFDFVMKKCAFFLRRFYYPLEQNTVSHVSHIVFEKSKKSKKLYRFVLEGNEATIYSFLNKCAKNACIDYVKEDKKQIKYGNVRQWSELSDTVRNNYPEAEYDSLERQSDWKNIMDVFKSRLPKLDLEFVDFLLKGLERKDIAQMPGWDEHRYDYHLKKLKTMKNLKGFKELLGL